MKGKWNEKKETRKEEDTLVGLNEEYVVKCFV